MDGRTKRNLELRAHVTILEAFAKGLIEGIKMFSYEEDNNYYVGKDKIPLNEALNEAKELYNSFIGDDFYKMESYLEEKK